MPRVLNKQTGEIEEVRQTEVGAAIASGSYDFVPDEVYRLKGKDGSVRGAVGRDVRSLQQSQGFGFETSDDERARLVAEDQEDRFGGVTGSVAAGAAGVARGVSLGLTDVGLRASGVNAEDLQTLRDYNPWASTAGEIVGAVAPAIASGGTSLLARTPAAIASQAGRSIAARGAGSSVGGRITAEAVGAAAEGALFTSGQYVSGVAMGNKELSAEAFVGSVGEGAMWGGALGGTFAAGSAAVSRARSGIQSRLGGLGEKADDAIDLSALGDDLTPDATRTSGLSMRPSAGDAASPRFGPSADEIRAAEIVQRHNAYDAPLATSDSVPMSKLVPKKMRTAKAKTRMQVEMDAEMERQLLSGEALASQADTIFRYETERSMATAKMARKLDDIDDTVAGVGAAPAREVDRGADLSGLSAKERTQRALADLEPDEVITPGSRKAPGRPSMEERFATARQGLDDGSTVADDALGQQLKASTAQLDDIRAKVAKVSEKGAAARKWIDDIKTQTAHREKKAARMRAIRGEPEDEFGDLMDRGVFAPRKTLRPVQDRAAAANMGRVFGMETKIGRELIDSLPDKIDDAARMAGDFDPVTGEVINASRMPALDDIAAGIDDGISIANLPGLSDEAVRSLPPDIRAVAEFEHAQVELLDSMKPLMDPDDYAKAAADQYEWREGLKAKDAVAAGPDGQLRGMNDAAGAYEMARALGIPLPEPDNLPVIGPLLGAYMKYRAFRMMGERAHVVRGPTAIVAEKSASMQDRISGVVKRIATGADKAAVTAGKHAATAKKGAVPALTTILGSELFTDDASPKRKAKEEAKSKSEAAESGRLYRQRLAELTAAAQNPERVKARIRQQVNAGVPEVQDAIEKVAIKKLTFLESKAPKDPRGPALLGQRQREWAPSAGDLTKFARYVRAAENPQTVLEDLDRGTLTYEAVEAMRAVYPTMYAEVQQEIAENVAELRTELPYAKRLQMSIFFELPVEATQRPEFVAAMQLVGAAEPEPQQPTVNMSGATSLSENTMLGMDRRAAR